MTKQSITRILLTILINMMGANTFAQDIEVKNADGKYIYYKWNENKTELIVTYLGNRYDTYSDEYSGTIVIPESVTYLGNNYRVTSIGDYAFSGCNSLTSVTIPNSVISIGNYAFYKCSELSTVIIPNSVIYIGTETFFGTAWYDIQPDGLVYAGKVVYKYKGTMPNNTKIVIEEGTKGIGNCAFYDCNGLTSVTIPNSVKALGAYAFWRCSGLTSVTIPNSVTSIRQSAFSGCSSLTSLTIPNSITVIDNGAFSGCSSLPSVTIPNSVTSIDNYAFSECTGLTSLTIPNSVRSIGAGAFYYCIGLTSVTIPNSVTSIEEEAFRFCSSLTSVTIPSSMTSISKSAFSGCSSITSVTIPNSITVIDNGAFSDCSSLTSVTIPNGVTTIGGGAFNGCKSLLSVTIPNSVTSIGNNAFSGCNIINVKITDLSAWCNLFMNDSNPIFSNNFHLFLNGEEIEHLIIPENVSIIGNYAFYHCAYITSVTIPNSVKTIGENAFQGCQKMETLKLSDELQIIKKGAFKWCTGLNSVTIPTSVEFIYQEAFANNTALKSLKALPKTPPFIYNNTFSDYSVPLIVPSDCLDAYKSADNWKNFTNISDGKQIFKLTYIVDGGVYKTANYYEGDAIIHEEAPTKEGYTFSGWSDIPETMPDHDVTVTGTFTINKYKLTYKVDGEVYKTYDIMYGATITPEPAPTKEGYTFSGWSEIPTTMPAHDVTVTGTFTYTSSKNLINDFEWLEANNKVEIIIGEPYQLKYSCSDNSLPFTNAYADSWVHYDFKGGQHVVNPPTGYSINEKGIVTGLVEGSYAIKFTGYIQPKSGVDKVLYITVVSEKKETEPNNSLDTANEVTSKIRFGLFNISDIDYFRYTDNNLKPGDYVTFKIHYYGQRENPFGYKWSTFCGNSYMGGGSLISQDQECQALVASGNTVYLEVYYDQSRSQYFNYGEEFVAEIYINGKPVNSGSQDTEEQQGNNNGHVKYKLTYIVDGNVYKSYELEEGTAITPESTPTKEGYTFSGWSWIPSKMPAEDVTVTGSFTVNKYKLTYKVDGEVYKSYDIEYGATITPEPTPTKDGYTFSGWSDIPETMPAHDVTVTSTFKASAVSDFKYNGIKYTVVSQSDQTVEVAASNQSAGSDGPTSYSGDIVIPSTVSYGDKTYTVIGIGQSAFVNCVGITSISLPNTLTYIRKEAFNLCLSLRSITIPESVTSYGYDVFSLTSISEITVLNPVPVEIPYNAFYYPQSNNNCILYVPYGSSNAYKNATEWKKFKTIVEMGKQPDMLDGHEYVDLGLPSGKCWATMNYGATSPEGYGSYLEWSSNSIISSNWGSGWTTPSLQDIRELENNCTWTWGQKNGHSGYTVKGKNGNSIFLPASGYMMMGQSSAGKVDQWVYYWTSTISGEMASIILSTATDVWYGEMNTVYTKLPIRPITKDSHSTVVQKCETPTISYNNGKLTFKCNTEGAICHSSITDDDIKSYEGNEVQLGVTYRISVYATKSGYDNSETVTATLCWIDVEPKTEGITNITANVRALPLLIQSYGSTLTVSGADDGTPINVYSINGTKEGSAISQNGEATIHTTLQSGSAAIVKVGNKSIKVVMK